MRRSYGAYVLGGMLLCVLAVTTVVVLVAPEPSPAADSTTAPRPGDERSRPGAGPPSWSSAGGTSSQRAEDRHSWKEEWHSLTPTQKSRTMASLARAHEDGMQSWQRCVRAAGGDKVQRSSCEKPLPPGLAKKQS